MKHTKLIFILFLLATLLTACAPPKAGKEPLTKAVWENLQYYFGLDWIFKATNPTTTYTTFVRMILLLLVFLLLFELFSHIPGLNKTSKRTALILSLAISALIAVFFPPALLMTIAITYTGFFAFFLVGIPTALAIWLAYAYEPATSKGYFMRAAFLLLALWIIGVMIHWSQVQLTDPRDTSLDWIGSLQALEALEKFGNWMWWILAGLIVYNLWHGIFGVGTADQTLGAATAHSRTFLGNIVDAWKGAAEKGIAKKALPKEAMTEELQLEVKADTVLKTLTNAVTLLHIIAPSPGTTPSRTRTLFANLRGNNESKYVSALDASIQELRDTMSLTQVPNRTLASLPAAARSSIAAAYRAAFPGAALPPPNADIANLGVQVLTRLRTRFTNTLATPATIPAEAQLQERQLANFVIPLVKAFAAANRP